MKLGWGRGIRQFTDGDFGLHRNMYKQTKKGAGCLTSFLSQMLVTYHLVRDHSALLTFANIANLTHRWFVGCF